MRGGRARGVQWEVQPTGHPQDKSSESEDNKHSESEEDSDEEESEEEDRDGDVDPSFREQLMVVLQAGKALVSGTSGRAPILVSARAHKTPACSLGICPSGWSG